MGDGLAMEGNIDMVYWKINMYPGTDQGELITSDERYKFIGEFNGSKPERGAVFEITSPQEKLLVWNGRILDGKVEAFFVKSKLGDSILRKMRGVKYEGMPRAISYTDHFTFTNSDVKFIGGDEFSFEGVLEFCGDVNKAIKITGTMVVQDYKVIDVLNVENDY